LEENITIRNLEKREFSCFKKLMKKFYSYARNSLPEEEKLKKLFDKSVDNEINLIFIGAFDNEKLAGIVSLTFGESTYKILPFAWCDDLYVEEDYRNKGIGRKLLEKAREIAESKNCSNILIGAGKDEVELHKFYNSIGFIDINCNLMSLPLLLT
jgi:GNAT superfamily N-acetyltransferase